MIFLTIYYLFEMGAIVNRIVNIDAPATTLAEQISVEMLQARRSERNYFLVNDPEYLQANRQAADQIKGLVAQIDSLEPAERAATKDDLEKPATLPAAVCRCGQHFCKNLAVRPGNGFNKPSMRMKPT